jgi:hypothetical protein
MSTGSGTVPGRGPHLTQLGLLSSPRGRPYLAEMANTNRDTPHGTPMDMTWVLVLVAQC